MIFAAHGTTASKMPSNAASFLPYVGLGELQEKFGLVKSLLAEFLGVMFLVLIGCGSCLGGAADFVRISLAFGVTVATLAQGIGHISGCHINPAVTSGLFFGRKIGLIKGVLYILAQCLGGVVGSALLQVKIFYSKCH
jgi:aquaporin related protein